MNVTGCAGSRIILILLGALSSLKLMAMPFEINEDLRGVWTNSIVAAASFRAKDPDKQLVGFNNAPEYAGAKGASSTTDDGNLNYRKGDVISAPLIYTTDLELRYRSQYGVHGKLRTWYDYAGERHEVPHGSIANGYQPNQTLDDSDYYDYNQFSGYQVLDLYTYGNWNIDDSSLSVRFGKQAINWGEGLLHLGINAFNPLNLAALGRPALRQDEALIPVNRLYSNLITPNGVSIEAFYALDWTASQLPACGTLAGSDTVFDPGCNAATSNILVTDQQQVERAKQGGPVLAPRGYAPKPRSGGQYGVSTRYFVEPLDTEFGLYFVNYHAVLPVLSIVTCESKPCSSAGGLELMFPEDVQAMAISAASGVRNLALSAELSHFHDLPVGRNFPEMSEAVVGRGIYADRMAAIPAGATFDGGWKADRTQLLLGGELDLTPTVGLSDAVLVGEWAGQWVNNLPGTDEERIGRSGNWGAASALNGVCQPRVQNTENGCAVDGYATDFSWGYRMLGIITLPQPALGLDLQPLLAWSHDVEGYSVEGAQAEGRQVLVASMRTIFQRAWFVDVGRSWVKSDTDYDPVRDKDVYFVSAGVSF